MRGSSTLLCWVQGYYEDAGLLAGQPLTGTSEAGQQVHTV